MLETISHAMTITSLPSLRRGLAPSLTIAVLILGTTGHSAVPPLGEVEGQPLAANARRLLEAMDLLGHPVMDSVRRDIERAAADRDARRLQETLDSHVLFVVQINPELRVKVTRGPAAAEIVQAGFTPVWIKILNDASLTESLRIRSPQAGPVYAGAARGILGRQQQTDLIDNENAANEPDRFMEVDLVRSPPMTPHLSGLEVEYAVALIYSTEPGKREATIAFDVGQGTEDLGFRAEVPVLFNVKPAIPVTLRIVDFDGAPTAARLTFRDGHDRIYPPQAKRLAPDFFFQPHIYRRDGGIVRLPPGEFRVTYNRGPEYRTLTRSFEVPDEGDTSLELKLERWIHPARHGFYSGDHHIHGAGCSHYEIPTQGVRPEDMFLQVKGEGLNVGCVLTWGPCFEFQRNYFSPSADAVSEPLTVLKYDLEISGFGSAALGHVCLLNLNDQTYPGSEGTKTKGWPSWTVPVMRWAKDQGGVTGYPHSDMFADVGRYAARYFARHDRDGNGTMTRDEAEDGLLPVAFATADGDGDGFLAVSELEAAAESATDKLPHLVLPAMSGAGAMEIFVSAAEGVCDFVSAMDTGRIGEWNTWYHLLNCGFPIKLSGETDFPCMSSRRVGQGRSYVKLGEGLLDRLEFEDWCRGIEAGRSYVSDGFAHALEFSVNEVEPGFGAVRLMAPGRVRVKARVAFAPVTPKAVAHGTASPPDGRRHVGDTRLLHGRRTEETVEGGVRLVEIVLNGEVAASFQVPADGEIHECAAEVEVDRSSWIALRQFPQLHTNPVDVLVNDRPIRASRDSALWCAESVDLLWENRSRHIVESEKHAARDAYDRARRLYRRRAAEAEETASAPARSRVLDE